MKWYLAKIVYRIICGEGNHRPQFDEQLRLISAEDELHAFQKARLRGEQEEDAFLNNNNKPVNWKFVDVSEIHSLSELSDGIELYSKIIEEESAEFFSSIIKKRAALLYERCLLNTITTN